MALSPTMAGPTPMPPAGGASPDGMAPANDTAGGENECIATICRTPDGKFVLYAGDEPEGDAEPGAEPQIFDAGDPAILRAVMSLLGTDAGAEKAFGDVRRGKMGAPPAAGGM